jgi:hypothetical protein
MAKDPAILIYPADWLKDEVSGCSIAAQGLWWRMLIVMHDSERRGYLQANRRPMTEQFIASKCGVDAQTYSTLLLELDDVAVPSRTAEGIIYNRRMVRDEEKRAQDRKRQQKHRCVTPDVTHDVTPSVTPLSVDVDVNALVVDLGTKTAKVKEIREVGFESEPGLDGEEWIRRFKRLWPKPGGIEVISVAFDAIEELVAVDGKKRLEAAEYIAQELRRCAQIVHHWPREKKHLIPSLHTVLKERRFTWDDALWEQNNGKPTEPQHTASDGKDRIRARLGLTRAPADRPI